MLQLVNHISDTTSTTITILLIVITLGCIRFSLLSSWSTSSSSSFHFHSVFVFVNLVASCAYAFGTTRQSVGDVDDVLESQLVVHQGEVEGAIRELREAGVVPYQRIRRQPGFAIVTR